MKRKRPRMPTHGVSKHSGNRPRRVDRPERRTHGYRATVLRANGRAFKFFSDGVHGGRAQAHRAAKLWISAMENSIPRLPRAKRMVYRRRNNRSGTSGVVRWPADGRKVQNAYWRAFWVCNPNENRKSQKFSIAAHGEHEAHTKAMTVRRRALKRFISETAK